jgi:hypothetical protein
MRTALFWIITQRVETIPYRRFRTTSLLNNPEEYSSHLVLCVCVCVCMCVCVCVCVFV